MQLNARQGVGRTGIKRKGKAEADLVSKSVNSNPFKVPETEGSRNAVAGVNRSYCYDQHNSSMQGMPITNNLVGGGFLNSSYEYPAPNQGTGFVNYVISQGGVQAIG